MADTSFSCSAATEATDVAALAAAGEVADEPTGAGGVHLPAPVALAEVAESSCCPICNICSVRVISRPRSAASCSSRWACDARVRGERGWGWPKDLGSRRSHG